ncbi:MAG: flagellar basal body rod protein FlgC [Deltaproteobacteria bacterium]|nr:flagellar basal body rod protein FlgC [Deltaproteobacteria bacterium]MBW2305575.1 flagellar basal body rod protein FlgC [Deltaproteobacteria bacterium]
MDFFDVLKISGSALSAQRLRLQVISNNLANAHSTRTSGGGPYRRRDVVFSTSSNPFSFASHLQSEMDGEELGIVRVAGVIEDPRPFRRVYDPGHPDAESSGYVILPNVNIIEEMLNLISATRAYEANVTVMQATKQMALKALEIGK